MSYCYLPQDSISKCRPAVIAVDGILLAISEMYAILVKIQPFQTDLKSSENADFGGVATLVDPNRDPKRVRTAWTSWTGWFEKHRILDTIIPYGLY